MSKSRVCAVACLFSLFGQAASQPTVEWEKGYSGGRVFIGKVDEEGNLYSTGFTNDAYWTRDVLILKTAQDGRVLWYHTIAGNGRLELGVDVEPDGRGNVYALARQTSPGGNATNFLTMKFSRTGQLLWSQSYSEGSATPSDLAVDAQGNCYVTGYTGAPRKAVTVKYSPSGVLQWAQRFSPGTPEASVTWDVRIDPAGNVVAAGSRETGQNAREYLVIKYGSSGSQIWVRTYVGAAGWHELWDTALDTAGNIYVTGVSAGQGTGEDCATLSLSPQGNQRWVRRFTGVGTENDNGRAIAVDSSGSVYVLGYKAAGSSSAPVVLKYNAASG
ncbi:MAG TPA: SBBP repeat-containing protein, partial [Fimbriimonadaceae bacterium]|nr:SBBP repeat-containing protein [Fimbriimonadaceae bacterium]